MVLSTNRLRTAEDRSIDLGHLGSLQPFPRILSLNTVERRTDRAQLRMLDEWGTSVVIRIWPPVESVIVEVGSPLQVVAGFATASSP